MFQTQKKKIGLLAIINSFFWEFLLLLYRQKYAIYQQNSEKNHVSEALKSTKISARSLRSRAMIYVFFASFWFSGLYKSS